MSTFVGSVSNVNASCESFNPSLSVSESSGFVDVIPSVSAVNVAQPPGPIPKCGEHGVVVSVKEPSGPGL